MDKKTRNIIIGITSVLLVAIIIVVVCIAVGNKNEEPKIENQQEPENVINENEDPEQNDNIEEEIEDDVQEEEEQEPENEINNEVVNNQENEQTQVNTETQQNQVIGREEQESITENEGPTDEEKVVELVKNEWGANDSTVSYNIANHDGDIYMVSVNSKDTTEVKAWYQVNLATEEITQL